MKMYYFAILIFHLLYKSLVTKYYVYYKVIVYCHFVLTVFAFSLFGTESLTSFSCSLESSEKTLIIRILDAMKLMLADSVVRRFLCNLTLAINPVPTN